MAGVHDGHRQRLKNRFEKQGLDVFDDTSALELLLFYSKPRTDTRNIANMLLKEFGDLPGVLEAGTEELCKLEGVGRETAVYLKLVQEMSRRYLARKQERDTISCTTKAGQLAVSIFMFEKTESVHVICLDGQRHVLCSREVAEGSISEVDVKLRDIVEYALGRRADGVILTHNHMNGSTQPTKDDIDMTLKLGRALHTVGIDLLDHIVVSGTCYTSMLDSGFRMR